MCKTILMTGTTDGIGFETAKKLINLGHHLIIHGRNSEKLASSKQQLLALSDTASVDSFLADLSDLDDVKKLAKDILEKYDSIDVLINNAGVFKTSETKNAQGLDVRFMVNTIAPFYLSEALSSILGTNGRIVNLSSAAQSPVNIDALLGKVDLDHMQAYSQSKLAIRLWSATFSKTEGNPVCISVNPGSLLASKMVREGFGIAGSDLNIGADIITKIALSPKMLTHNGQYFDNDQGHFSEGIMSDSYDEMANLLIESMHSILNA
ncbi:SDR family NAD(P)-dependent oxidoreductase [Psychromonas sp. 14N.309.X.WAT.B.A12]|uniref:SDR family NAD(P)-dependent oxidoreductase n=1 Tax=Psychromonas sp. 14N.309.X.WAT.B.A12 TaxID=2998322 RepID=UPI0025B0F01F|nr:SDR family NAD(P)-dependent oxidoreductase [Psychromonas sp. 14N.309.X.WAT.B.A12]MDN2662159.1 SDR family NAD(P)-dependent oxidoreductase [Psychromonas sp. 14N.309.X.WAT.B.A12]